MYLETLVYSFLLFSPACYSLQPFNEWGHERIQLEDVSIHFRYSASGKPPLLLVHGSPQHSRTWINAGPILAETYTVIAPDNRGAGDSSLSTSDNYTAAAAGADLRAILDFLNVSKTYVLAHDKGVGLATSLALESPELVEKMILAEYVLPGYGYYTDVSSTSIFQNWQLAFFATPEVAQFFIQGKEQQMLEWNFWHSSYSGDDVIPNDLMQIYTRAISKPGFLRSMLMYFGSAFMDEVYFTQKINSTGKLQMPIMAMGGEASISPASVQEELFGPVAANLSTAVVPKAGHWIADENPTWVAQKALQFFGSNIPSIDISWLDDTLTFQGGMSPPTPGTNGTG